MFIKEVLFKFSSNYQFFFYQLQWKTTGTFSTDPDGELLVQGLSTLENKQAMLFHMLEEGKKKNAQNMIDYHE